jgi:uncharacterized DUF497 family protein
MPHCFLPCSQLSVRSYGQRCRWRGFEVISFRKATKRETTILFQNL